MLGLVCEKMAKRVAAVNKEREDRQAAQSLARMSHVVALEEEGAAAEEGAEAEIWSVTDSTEEELDAALKTDEEEGEMDVVAALLELAQWECVEVEDV